MITVCDCILFARKDLPLTGRVDAEDGSTAIPCKLAGLPPELHGSIIDVLRGDIDTKTKSHGIRRIAKQQNSYGFKEEDQEREDNRRNRCAEFVHDLARWSSTSQFFRHLLAPYIFKAVHLTNDDFSGSSAAALSESLHNKHVKELNFRGWARASDQMFLLSCPPDNWPTSILEGISLSSRSKLVLADLCCVFPRTQRKADGIKYYDSAHRRVFRLVQLE